MGPREVPLALEPDPNTVPDYDPAPASSSKEHMSKEHASREHADDFLGRALALLKGGKRRQPGEASSGAVVWACAFYMIVSIGMNMINKEVSHFNDIPATIVGMQMAFAAVSVGLLLFRTLHFGNRRDVGRWALTVPVFWSLSICFNMLALQKTGLGATMIFRYIMR